ncbi:Magnesium transporter ALR2 [Smittium mucronatum]|uniref:Magnesium transporter ALR2 n=1 Tax=Smittium mucronatum TaxID=133383 RepID=A0A1R0H3T6_9FUNG|nr:Magnesium transporter ALR2 [Smittium mucronatum]
MDSQNNSPTEPFAKIHSPSGSPDRSSYAINVDAEESFPDPPKSARFPGSSYLKAALPKLPVSNKSSMGPDRNFDGSPIYITKVSAHTSNQSPSRTPASASASVEVSHSADEVKGSIKKAHNPQIFKFPSDSPPSSTNLLAQTLAEPTNPKCFASPMEVLNVNFPHALITDPERSPLLRPLSISSYGKLPTNNIKIANFDPLDVFLKRKNLPDDIYEDNVYFSAGSETQSESEGESERLEEMNLIDRIREFSYNNGSAKPHDPSISYFDESGFPHTNNEIHDSAGLSKEQRLANLLSPEKRPLLSGHAHPSFKLDPPFSLDSIPNTVSNHKLSTYLDTFPSRASRILFYSPLISPIRANSLETVSNPEIGNLSSIFKFVEKSNSTFWLDILAPTNSEVRILSKTFKIHPLTAEDIIENEESIRSKVDVYSNYYFLVLDLFGSQGLYGGNPAQWDESPYVTYIIVTKLGVISFHTMPTCRRSIILRWLSQLQVQAPVTPDWINYAIMDDLTDQIIPLVQTIELEVETIDELVLILSSSEQSDMLLRIGSSRKKLMCILRVLQGKSDALRTLIKMFSAAPPQPALPSGNAPSHPAGSFQLPNTSKRPVPLGPKLDTLSHLLNSSTGGTSTPGGGTRTPNNDVKFHDIKYYLEDILDHVITMSDNASHLEQVLSRAYSNYLAKISIELTQSSNRTNDVVAKLSVLASVLIPLNLITGLWGMNVKVPGQDENGIEWFIGIVLSIISFVILSIYICIRLELL